MIQMDEADRLEKKWSGGKCNHIWEKNFILAQKPVTTVAQFVVQLVLKLI